MSTTPIWKDVFDAALSNDIDSVKYFIEVKGDPVTITNDEEKTIAHIAVEFGRLNVLKYILDKNASLLEESDVYGLTVLHRAAAFGDLDVVKYLVEERGANIYQSTLHLPGNTAFHIAAQKGKFYVFEYFVKKRHVDVNLCNRLGEPALFSAAEKPYMRIIQYLVEDCDADPMIMDTNQDNVLYKSARRGDLMLPKYLLDKMKMSFDVNWVDGNGYTALNLASKYNKVGFVNFMIQKNASIFIADTLKRTPLHHAVAGAYYHLCKLLVENGASYHVKDVYGVTPLEMATDERVRTLFFMRTLKEQHNKRVGRSVYGFESSAPHASLSSRENDWPPKKLLGNENVRSTNPTFHSFLLVLNTVINRFRDSIYRNAIHPSLLSPPELIQQRMNQAAVHATEKLLIFEDQ